MPTSEQNCIFKIQFLKSLLEHKQVSNFQKKKKMFGLLVTGTKKNTHVHFDTVYRGMFCESIRRNLN